MADKPTFVRLTEGLRQRAEEEAEREHRNLSNMLRVLIEEALNARAHQREEAESEKSPVLAA